MTTTETTTVREQARQAIIGAAQEYWERSMSLNYHSLVVNSDGTHYWAAKINSNEMSADEYFGRDCGYRTLHTVGLGSCAWNGADEAVYETRELTPSERKTVADVLRERRNNGWTGSRVEFDDIDLDGEVARFDRDKNGYGRSYKISFGAYGTRWYVQTDELLHWTDAHQGIGASEMVEEALTALDELPEGFFDDEVAADAE